MYYKTILILSFHFGICSFLSAQDSFEFKYEVDKIYPSVSITAEKLNDINSLAELNQYYKSSWVKEFISVDISAYQNGDIKVASNNTDKLTAEQKELILQSDLESNISVNINYIPDNTLSHNDPQKFNFTFTLAPDEDATFLGGQEKLLKYLEKNAISQIELDRFQANQLTAVEFSIDKNGKVTNAEIYDMDAYGGSKNEKNSQVLLSAICQMPDWQPASYASGDRVQQDFVLRVGDMNSCTSNLFNIRGDQKPAFDTAE